jgi:hypothetical protein
MKKYLFALLVAILATTSVNAQQISVVSASGSTTLYNSLPEAIKGASANSVLYLPGGGFNIADSVIITKKLTIIGIGHKSNNDNADGNTTIVGGLRFGVGSSGSAVIGCYITDQVYIGVDGEVDDVLVKQCNAHSVDVNNVECSGIVIYQNYIRDDIAFTKKGGEATIKNNVIGAGYYGASIEGMSSGVIENNIIMGGAYYGYFLKDVTTAIITGNILIRTGTPSCGSLTSNGNACLNGTWGDYPIKITAVDWDSVFEKWNNGAINPNSNFHFKEAFASYEHQVGIYAGDSFVDSQLPPTPRIVAKKIPDQTDASGKLSIKVRVKASE